MREIKYKGLIYIAADELILDGPFIETCVQAGLTWLINKVADPIIVSCVIKKDLQKLKKRKEK